MGGITSQACAALILIPAFTFSAIAAPIGNDAAGNDLSPHAPAVVSVDFLRHPIAPKVRQRILRAMEKMDSGEYETAISQLRETLGKYPQSALYVQDLLGVADVKTGRFQAALSSFEQAVSLLPHDAMTHYNFGLALMCAGDYSGAARRRFAARCNWTRPTKKSRKG